MNFNKQDRECIVTLSPSLRSRVNSAKGLSRWAERCFASLSMTNPVLVVKIHNRGPTSMVREDILTAFPSVTMKILAASLDLSPDAVVVVNAAGTIVLVNAQVETMFGYREEELVGQPVEMLLPERLHTLHAAHRARYASAPRLRPMGRWLIVEGRRKDGH